MAEIKNWSLTWRSPIDCRPTVTRRPHTKDGGSAWLARCLHGLCECDRKSGVRQEVFEMVDMTKRRNGVEWLNEPEDHSYPAAKSCLNLVYHESVVDTHVYKLRRASLSEFRAKDF